MTVINLLISTHFHLFERKINTDPDVYLCRISSSFSDSLNAIILISFIFNSKPIIIYQLVFSVIMVWQCRELCSAFLQSSCRIPRKNFISIKIWPPGRILLLVVQRCQPMLSNRHINLQHVEIEVYSCYARDRIWWNHRYPGLLKYWICPFEYYRNLFQALTLWRRE